MKHLRLPCFSLLLAVLISPLAAQTAPAPAAAPSAPKPLAAAKPLAPTRVAYVNTAAFIDENTGIKQLVKVLQQLEAQFQPKQNEILSMKERYSALAQEVAQLRANPASDQKVIAGKIAEAQQIQRTMKLKGDEAQTAYGKRTQELRDPIDAEIAKEMPNFIAERGIDLLLDGSALQGALLVAKGELNVTKDFIAYFNAKHP